jgi:hypothetical protein
MGLIIHKKCIVLQSAPEDQKVDEEEGIKEDQGQDEELQEDPGRLSDKPKIYAAF